MKYQQPYGTPEDSPYINGDPTIARLGSIPPAAAFEDPQRELVNIITKSNIVPAAAARDQVAVGIRSQYMNYGEDHGTPNNLIVDFDPHIRVYTRGLVLRVLVRWDNTSASRIDAGAGWAEIRRHDGYPLVQGNLRARSVANIIYDGTKFQLLNIAPTTIEEIVVKRLPIPYCVDSSPIANNVDCMYDPKVEADELIPGWCGLVKIANTNTNEGSEVALRVNEQPYYELHANGHGRLYPYDIQKDDVKLIVFDGQRFWLDPDSLARRFGAVTAYVRWDAINDDAGERNADGTENTPQKAFRTIQRAYEKVAARYSPSPMLVIDIQLGVQSDRAHPHTWYQGATFGPYSGWVSVSAVDKTPGAPNRANYIVLPNMSGPFAQPCISANQVMVTLNGITLAGNITTAHEWAHLHAGGAAYVQITNIQFESWVPITGQFISVITSAHVAGGGSIIFQGFNNQHQHAIATNSGGTFSAGSPWPSATAQYFFYNTPFVVGSFAAAWLSLILVTNAQIFQAGCIGRQWWAVGNALIAAGSQVLPGNLPGLTDYNGTFVP